MASPLITRRSVVLAKVEGTYGTDPTPTVGANAILTRMPTINPDALLLERNNVAQSFSPFSPVVGRILWKAAFELEMKSQAAILAGSSGAALEIDALLQACGLNPTYTAEGSLGAGDGYVTYGLISTAIKSITSYIYIDQILNKVKGAFGDLSMKFMAGEYPVLSTNLMGLYSATTDATPGSPSYADEDPTMVQSVSLAIDSYAVTCPEIDISLNNKIQEYRDVNSANGMKRIRLTDRRPTAKFKIEEPLIAEKSFWAMLTASAPVAVSFTHGSVAGKKCLVTIPAFTVTNLSRSDLNGIGMIDVEGVCARFSDGGDDELTVKFF